MQFVQFVQNILVQHSNFTPNFTYIKKKKENQKYRRQKCNFVFYVENKILDIHHTHPPIANIFISEREASLTRIAIKTKGCDGKSWNKGDYAVEKASGFMKGLPDKYLCNPGGTLDHQIAMTKRTQPPVVTTPLYSTLGSVIPTYATPFASFMRAGDSKLPFAHG
ncbi:hypothetical protein APICC_01642 [Apis cerana cerana]|uniref:Uncharacterized protein n=1 Tax=Apis cerana cerana TaxID=94128 RepID=A0A2A3EMG9_APICC|nr:hypothetical protein APICC_01642 [Apis cerana cerana]